MQLRYWQRLLETRQQLSQQANDRPSHQRTRSQQPRMLIESAIRAHKFSRRRLLHCKLDVPKYSSSLIGCSLEGPAVEVKVTMEEFEKSWHLPEALSFHFSPFLRVSMQDRLGTGDRPLIRLEDFNPTAFATFVQWMYYGTYNPQFEVPGPPVGDHHIDVWILGNKLEVPALQDLAMSQIVSQYETYHRPLTTSTFLRVCAKTATNAPLRHLLLDLLAQNFTNQERVKGTLEEWDITLQEYPDARLALLRSFWAQGSRMKPEGEYSATQRGPSSDGEMRSTTAFEAGRLQLNCSTLPKIKSEIKKEPEKS